MKTLEELSTSRSAESKREHDLLMSEYEALRQCLLDTTIDKVEVKNDSIKYQAEFKNNFMQIHLLKTDEKTNKPTWAFDRSPNVSYLDNETLTTFVDLLRLMTRGYLRRRQESVEAAIDAVKKAEKVIKEMLV